MPLIDIDIDDFLSNCSKRDINQIIEALIEDGYLNKSTTTNSSTNICIVHDDHIKSCIKLIDNYYQLSIDECDIVKKIANRF